ncbi:metallophosphoesterase [Cryptosporangium phraense]|uniref:Metallophosphoesterase n=1 Tax=Cryptosporangium phraense TaxID=2593070 RepID=A0A545AF70_9ACTN|nr:metallophosphoesterase [Cryptosporangium phraense]TQS39986.1 metallophosphoesterase [Cryptosporangium phraense]
MRFLFLLVPLALVVGAHVWVWWRLFGAPFRSRRARILSAAGLVAVVACVPFGLRTGYGGPAFFEVLAWIGLLYLAVLFYLLLVLVVLEPVRLAAHLLWARKEPHSDASPRLDRRLFLARATAVTAGAVAFGTTGFGLVEARHVEVKRVPMTLTKLDPRFDGYRIAVISDVHLSHTLRRPFLHGVVSQVNGLNADAVAIVGDLVDGTVEDLGGDAAELANLRSKHGTYFVTGNHEYRFDLYDWLDYLPTLGVKLLRNERVDLGGFDLAGVNDVSAEDWDWKWPGQAADLNAALDGRDVDRPVILLAHQPAQWPDAVKFGVDLQLSGHTHGGQAWPFDYVVARDQPVIAGRARSGASQLYVTSGIGNATIPVRVGAQPEISLIELHSAV